MKSYSDTTLAFVVESRQYDVANRASDPIFDPPHVPALIVVVLSSVTYPKFSNQSAAVASTNGSNPALMTRGLAVTKAFRGGFVSARVTASAIVIATIARIDRVASRPSRPSPRRLIARPRVDHSRAPTFSVGETRALERAARPARPSTSVAVASSRSAREREKWERNSFRDMASRRRASREASGTSAPVELVCLDFDLTLLRVHSFASKIRAEDVREGRRDAIGDFVDAAFLIEFVGA
jgi:hypothetical protein